MEATRRRDRTGPAGDDFLRLGGHRLAQHRGVANRRRETARRDLHLGRRHVAGLQRSAFTQSIAASNDRGRTFRKFDHNPVLGQIIGGNRDPKVIWHGPTKKWVMALYLDGDQYALFSSPDLKQWTKLCDIPPFGSGECPDIFELPIEGAGGKSRWIFWGGNNTYLIGDFDGTKFLKESGPHRFEFGANYYAAQTYSDIPAADGRRIQIGWMSGGKYPHAVQSTDVVSWRVTLRKTPGGLRLFSGQFANWSRCVALESIGAEFCIRKIHWQRCTETRSTSKRKSSRTLQIACASKFAALCSNTSRFTAN